MGTLLVRIRDLDDGQSELSVTTNNTDLDGLIKMLKIVLPVEMEHVRLQHMQDSTTVSVNTLNRELLDYMKVSLNAAVYTKEINNN